jgi:hypothetical protein
MVDFSLFINPPGLYRHLEGSITRILFQIRVVIISCKGCCKIKVIGESELFCRGKGVLVLVKHNIVVFSHEHFGQLQVCDKRAG